MKVPVSWLHEYVELTLPLEERTPDGPWRAGRRRPDDRMTTTSA